MHELVKNAVIPAIRARRPQRILLVSNAPEDFPDLASLASLTAISLHAGRPGRSDVVQCDSAELPFQDASFEVIVMQHVFTDGAEPELDEVQRLLSGGGELFVLGRGGLGPGAWLGRSRDELPGLRVRRMCRELRQRSFTIERCLGVGIMGVALNCERRWQQPILPFTDNVLILGRHHANKPIVTPLRFSRPQTVGVQSAAVEHLSREAV